VSGAEVKPKAEVVGEVIEAYLRAAIGWMRPNSYKEISRYLRKQWAPLHSKLIDEVRRRDVATILRTMEGQAGVQARMALSSMFNWAIREGYEVVANPVTGTNRPKTNGTRARVLSNDELAVVWRACDDGDFGRVVRLLMLTGQRRNEVGHVARAEIEGDVWTIPAGRTKNKRAHSIPLTPLALSLLPSRGAGRVFRVGSWSRAKASLDARAGISAWILHDLRRTCATGMADLGVLPHVIEAVLNHVSGARRDVAGIYNRARYSEEVRDALQRWSVHVSALVG
jgi:integrase